MADGCTSEARIGPGHPSWCWRKILAPRYGVRNVRVFGSVVRGEDGPESNVDLLVEFEPQLALALQAWTPKPIKRRRSAGELVLVLWILATQPLHP